MFSSQPSLHEIADFIVSTTAELSMLTAISQLVEIGLREKRWRRITRWYRSELKLGQASQLDLKTTPRDSWRARECLSAK